MDAAGTEQRQREGISQSEGNHSITDSVRLWMKNNNEEIILDYNSVTESKEEYEVSVCLCGG